MNNTEGNVYSCHIKKSDSGYSVWPDEYPHLIVTGVGIADCEEKLHELLLSELGDGESIIDYLNSDKDRETIAEKKLYYYMMLNNYSLQLPDLDRYFSKERCPACNQFFDQRNEEVIELDCKIASTDAIGIELSNILIMSERLKNILEPYASDSYETREVKFTSPKRVKFFEVIWKKDAIINSNAVEEDSEIGLYHGWQCSLCSNGSIFYQTDNGFMFYASERQFLSQNKRLIYLNNFVLCIPVEVLSEIRNNFKLRQISTEPLNIVSHDLTRENPQISIREVSKKTRKLP